MSILLSIMLAIGNIFSFLPVPKIQEQQLSTAYVTVETANATIPARAVVANAFVTTSGASSVQWSNSNRILANHAIVALYPLFPYVFPTNGGGSYTATAGQITTCVNSNIAAGGGGLLQDCDLGNLAIGHSVGTPGGVLVGYENAVILFASPGQINICLSYITNTASGNLTNLRLYKWNGSITNEGHRAYSQDAFDNEGTLTFEPSNTQPFLDYSVSGGGVVGTVYGISDGTDGYPAGTPVPLKSVANGPNPTNYKNGRTFLQLYFTGIMYDENNPGPGGAVNRGRFVYDNQDGSPYTQVQHNIGFYKQSNGVYVANIFAPPAGWGSSGVHSIKIGHGNLTGFGQTGITTGYVVWQ